MQPTLIKVQEYLDRFEKLLDLVSKSHAVERLSPQIVVLYPSTLAGNDSREKSKKDVVLTISALIHGVEVVGLAILVELLELVTRGELLLKHPIGLALGNVPAALKAVRFVERDLNRSFGRDCINSAEERRADELERLFTRSEFLLDIHQVKLKIDRPFWIFPYTKNGYKFARAVAPDVSVVTHWGKGFSQDGRCSDEWVNTQGGAGTTIELGQNGFDPEQIRRGVDVCKKAIQVSALMASGQTIAQADMLSRAPLYTWGEIVPYPKTGHPVLDLGWHNFKRVKAGETLGTFNGDPIKAKVSGPVLFPKYPDPRADGSYGDEPPAAELIRILREISEDDLPK